MKKIKPIVIVIDIGKFFSKDGGLSWTRKHVKLMDLPPGYTSRKDRGHGYDFINECGDIVEQHPVDDNSIRTLIWNYYYRGVYVQE